MARRNFITCVYETDEGKRTLRRMDARYQSQLNGATPPGPLLGALAADAGEKETLVDFPVHWEPRTVQLQTADGAFTGRIPVFTIAAYSAIAMGDTVNFFDGQGATHAGLVVGKMGERTRHKRDTV